MATQHLTALRARARERYRRLRAELEDDPMLVDSEDYNYLPHPSIEDLVDICCGWDCELGVHQTTFLIGLPDELLLRVFALLLRGNNSKGLESFSITCRHFHHLTTDPVLLNQYMATTFPWDMRYLYPNTEWTISLIKRFLRYEDQQEEFFQILGNFVSRRRALRMGFDGGKWVRIIEVAIKITQRMEGLQDDNPSYRLLQWMPFPWLVALHYTSLVFGRKFMSAHGHKLSSINLEENGSWERLALRHIFLRDGAVEATKLLYWDSQPDSVFNEMTRNFKKRVLHCAIEPDVRKAPLWLVRPERWIHHEIQGNKDRWLRESRGGLREEAWNGTGFKTEDRACILACLHNWSGGVPGWLCLLLSITQISSAKIPGILNPLDLSESRGFTLNRPSYPADPGQPRPTLRSHHLHVNMAQRESYQLPEHRASGPAQSQSQSQSGGAYNYSANATLVQQPRDSNDPGVTYKCGECALPVKLYKGDTIRCSHCGHRVMYKERTRRMVQFEAR